MRVLPVSSVTSAHDPARDHAAACHDRLRRTEAGGILTVDLAAIAANWKRLYGMTVPVECGAVVKADAYGCGIERVVPAVQKVVPNVSSPISRKAAACAPARMR